MKAKRYIYLSAYLAMCLLMSFALAQESGQEGWWMKEPIRWVQTNLRQTDAGLDARRLAEQLADMRANVVLMGMGGIAAYYPTAVEFHYRGLFRLLAEEHVPFAVSNNMDWAGKLAVCLGFPKVRIEVVRANCQFALPFSEELMTRKWRVAILGLGHWYSAYNLARALREYPKAELAAVAWHNSAQLAAFTSDFQIPGYHDYGELLKREDIDLVHIATPVSEMADCAIRAAQSGKHMVLGKPMAMTMEQADLMVEAVETSGVKCVAFQGTKRLRSGDLKARIEAGEIGEIILMHQTARWSIAEDWYRSGSPGWFADPRQTPGGAFIDEGIYWLDQLRWLAGSEVIQVEAKMANLVHRDIEVEDWGMATLTFANGIIATLEAAWTINAPRRTGPSPKQNCVLRLEVIGARGEIIDEGLRVPGRAVLAAGASGWVFEREAGEPFGPPSPFPLDHLIECVESDRLSAASIQEARKSFRVALAAYQSARAGQPISLQW